MTMNAQQANAQQPVREEERILGINYERALAMVPELVRKATKTEPEELGDGYFVSKVTEEGGRSREVTIRLGRQGPDTRISVRVESYSVTKYVLFFIAFAVVTMGLGLLVALPWLMKLQRDEARKRELLIHKLFRSIEDAVAEQGAAPNYRVAPGADAPALAEPEPVETETEEAAAAARTR